MSNHPPISPTPSSHVYDLPSESSRVVPVAGLVFAIVSFLAVPFFVLLGVLINAFFPNQGSPLGFVGVFVGIVSSIVGVILSALGLRSPSRRGVAIVGLTLSIVMLVLLVLFIGLFFVNSEVIPGGHPSPAPTPIYRQGTP